MGEVFPGAMHDRWSHTVGTFSALTSYLNALLADAEVPTFRLLANWEDLSQAFVATLLHDIGQFSFGHDLEEACPFLFSHTAFIPRLLGETFWGGASLIDVIKKTWPEVEIGRVLYILEQDAQKSKEFLGHVNDKAIKDILAAWEKYRPCSVDGILADCIDGPIDIDKFDYLLRDSVVCGVPYGHGIDTRRFLSSLTVGAPEDDAGNTRLSLAYKAKGRAAIASILLARYQLYGSVYWHHTFRCIQAMFVHAATTTLGPLRQGMKVLADMKLNMKAAQDLIYWHCVCGMTWGEIQCKKKSSLSPRFLEACPRSVEREPALEILWRLAGNKVRNFVEFLAQRKLYKRIFELRVGELGERADYSALKAELQPENRVKKAAALCEHLLNAVQSGMAQRAPGDSASEDAAQECLQKLKTLDLPLVVIDFPLRGIPEEKNMPIEISDPARKYFSLPARTKEDSIFHVVRTLQQYMAAVRVYAHPDLHELILRYLQSANVRGCVETVIPSIKRTR